MTTLTAAKIRQDRFIEKLILSKKFWILFLSFSFLYPIYRSVTRKLPDNLPVLSGPIQFELVNQHGDVFGSQELLGFPYIAQFVSLDCKDDCSESIESMRKIQHRVRGLMNRIRLVTFSTNSLTSRPPLLLEMAKKYQYNRNIWYFLTGINTQANQMSDLMDNVFKVEKSTEGRSQFVLVDSNGSIRRYYSDSIEGVNQLMIDVGLLMNRENI